MVDIRYMTFFGVLCTLMFSNIGFGIPDELPELKQPEPKVDIIQEEPKVKKIKYVKIEQNRPFKARELADWKITAYCPCKACSGKYGRNTATGVKARSNHTIAVDPKIIKYGSKVYIDGKKYIAEDCGGGVKGYHIDIFFDTHAEVEAFGKQYKQVIIKKGEKNGK